MYVSKYFNLGNIVVTSGIHEAMKESKRFTLEIGVDLQRYSIKDWGNLCEEDKWINDEALKYPDDLYILAAYQTCRGKMNLYNMMDCLNYGSSNRENGCGKFIDIHSFI